MNHMEAGSEMYHAFHCNAMYVHAYEKYQDSDENLARIYNKIASFQNKTTVTEL